MFASFNPATNEKIWEGKAFLEPDIEQVVKQAKESFKIWSSLPLETRIQHLKNYQQTLKKEELKLATIISEETGKPLWDSKNEVLAMINKVDISIKAYHVRCPDTSLSIAKGTLKTKHKPHGIVAVFGPYNFPGHLPNGHIVPALLAGNVCIFKPSELTPKTAIFTHEIWKKSGLPENVLQLTLGEKETGKLLAAHKNINGIFFTGSFATGKILLKQFAETPEKILALEMGGNNPLIVHQISDINAAAYTVIQSAFLSSGQRCTCARRLIIVKNKTTELFIDTLIKWTKKIKVGAFTDMPEPFMGPLVTLHTANQVLAKQEELQKKGGQILVEMKQLKKDFAFLTPGIIDVTDIKNRIDEEIFGPLLQVIYVNSFKEAIAEANNTVYGLSAGLLSDEKDDYETFYRDIKAGVLSWNTGLTNASSEAPFGGIGHSGNYRPSAFYAADYSAYPVASIESEILAAVKTLLPGLS